MGTVVNLQTQTKTFGDGYDSLVVREYYTSTDGGVTLDVTGFAPANIRSGHVIIRKTAAEADGTYIYKPMPVTGGAYDALPADHEYYGHAVQSVAKDKPFVGVTYHAKINPLIGKDAKAQAAGIYNLTPILAALKDALTHVIYKGDKE